jgi:5-methylcytosine-specific restriction endonuclease McrA
LDYRRVDELFLSMSWYRNTYLKSKDWKNLRLAIMHYAHYECESCGNNQDLDVHHWKYRKIWDVKPIDLTVLCRACHKKYHSGQDKNRFQIVKSLSRLKKVSSYSKHPNVEKGLKALTKLLSETYPVL